MFSCKNNANSKETVHMLCPRNIYSRNGVEIVYHYSYGTKEGEIDFSSKELYSIEKYDSLGNIIYYKGSYYPSITDVALSTYHYEIRKELDLPWNTTYTYKMEYQDTTFLKASLFDTEGTYIARIEKSIKENVVHDSVYVRDRLIYVKHIFKDVEGRDSLILSYDEYRRKITLVEEEQKVYSKNGNTIREDYITKTKDIISRNPNKFDIRKGFSEFTYDEQGRVVAQNHGRIKRYAKYDERGFIVESIIENDFEKSKSLYKSTYYNNGLLKNSSGYADMSILESYSEYEYNYYKYSPNQE